MKEEFFTIKSNSKVWPSDDPKDKPGMTATCNLCGESIMVPENGDSKNIDKHVNTHYLRYKGEIE